MTLGNKGRGSRTELEKELRKLMIDLDVDQSDLATYEGVTPQAINNRLKRLNKVKYEYLRTLIQQVSKQKLQ